MVPFKFYHNQQQTIEPPTKKIKLPSISNIKLFNFRHTFFSGYQQNEQCYQQQQQQQQQQLISQSSIPQLLPSNVNNSLSSPGLGYYTQLNEFSTNEYTYTYPSQITSNMLLTTSRTSPDSFSSKYSSSADSSFNLNSSTQLTKKRKLISSKIYDLDSFEFKRKPPKYFPNLKVDSDFIYKNLLREQKLLLTTYNYSATLYPIDYYQDECEIIIQENDIIKWKILYFFLDYLKLNDIRSQNKILSKLEIDNTFKILINLILKPTVSTPLKSISIDLKTIKSSDSKLTKKEVLETIENNFDEFFINYEIKNDKKKRRIIKKPKWGLGHKDELNIVQLDILVNDV